MWKQFDHRKPLIGSWLSLLLALVSHGLLFMVIMSSFAGGYISLGLLRSFVLGAFLTGCVVSGSCFAPRCWERMKQVSDHPFVLQHSKISILLAWVYVTICAGATYVLVTTQAPEILITGLGFTCHLSLLLMGH